MKELILEKWSDLPKVTQQINCTVGTISQTIWPEAFSSSLGPARMGLLDLGVGLGVLAAEPLACGPKNKPIESVRAPSLPTPSGCFYCWVMQ